MKVCVYESDTASVVLLLFVKVPIVCTGLGNDTWEGGLVLLVNVVLPSSFLLMFGLELDWLVDSDGSGKHVAIVNLINLVCSLILKLSMVVELWFSINCDFV